MTLAWRPDLREHPARDREDRGHGAQDYSADQQPGDILHVIVRRRDETV